MRVAKATKAKTAQHRKSSPQDLVTFPDKGADSVARANAIANLASDGFYLLEPQFAACLSDADPFVRGQAILSLLGLWRLADYFGEAARMLREDPDEYARLDATAALSNFGARGTDEERVAALREMVRALYSEGPADEDQGDLYGYIVRLLRPASDWTNQPYPFDRERDVDKTLIAPYLPDGQPGSRSRG